MARITEPGDPDFDWSQYDKYHAANDPVAAAKATLEATAPQAKEFANITAHQFPAAAAVRQAHPGAYDDMTDAELESRINKSNQGHLWNPEHSNVPVAMLQGFLGGAAEGAQSPSGKAALGGAAALIPGGPVVAGATEALANLLNPPATMGEAVTNVAEPTAVAAIGRTAPSMVGAARAIPTGRMTGVAGAGLGAYRGYKRGGIPGAIEEGAIGGIVGSRIPHALQALRMLGGAGAAVPMTEAAQELPMVTATGEELPLPEAWKPFVRR